MKATTQLLSLLVATMASFGNAQEVSPELIQNEAGQMVSPTPVMTNGPAGWVFVGAVEAPPVPPPSVEPSVTSATNVFGLAEGSAVPSERRIKLVEGGAEADYGLLKVFFPADIAGAESVRVRTADGRELEFRPTFLAIRDALTGESRLLGQVTNRVGLVVSTDWVVYTNAFSGIRADLRYRYSGGLGANSLEQDVLLHESPVPPEEFSAADTRIEVWSEWINTAAPSKEAQMLDLRANTEELTTGTALVADENLSFGSAKIGAGHAFSSQSEGDKIPVGKLWGRVDNRDWLIETVDYLALKPKLEALPIKQAALPQGQKGHDEPSLLIRSLRTPAKDLKEDRSMWLVSADPSPANTVVLDFVIVSSVPVSAGIVSWWPAGANANDAITNNHGTFYNPGTYAAGKVGQAFKFDGLYDHVRIPNQPNLRFTNAITFEGWVYPTNTGYYREILSKWDAVGGYNQKSFDFSLYPGGRFYILASPGGTDTGATFILTTNSAPLNAWTHVAGTYDGSTLKVYFNGVLENEGVYTNGIFPGTNSLGIGAATGGAAPGSMLTPFPGMIDEPALYSRALSASEISAIYNAGVAGKYNPTCVVTPTNLVAWWSGDGNIYDLARTNHATLQNGATYEAAVASDGFSLDGINDHVLAADDNAMNIGVSNNLTIELWLKPLANTNTANAMSVFGKRDVPTSGPVVGYELFLINGAPAFQIASSASYANYFSTNDLRGGYHHLAITMDRSSATGLKFYVDGVIITNFNPLYISGSLSNAAPIRIGVHPSPSYNCYYKGVIDEISFYRRALNSSEISALYAAGGAGKCKVDSDGDELTDLQESFLGSNPNDVDSDYDGRRDGQEIEESTNPLNPSSVTNVLLGRWRFDNTNTWVGAQGQTPLVFTNLAGVPSWSTNAVRINHANPSRLIYRDMETNGSYNINFNCRQGTALMWFKPDWNSGIGPGNWADLLCMGNWTDPGTAGWWGIDINPTGTALKFLTQGTSEITGGTTHFNCPINWSSNRWYQIAVTYSTNTTALYVNGQLITNGLGVVNYPNASVRALGFSVGSFTNGILQVRGQLEELQTFNYPLSSLTISNAYQAVINSSTFDKDADGIPNSEDADPNNPFAITINTPAPGAVLQ